MFVYKEKKTIEREILKTKIIINYYVGGRDIVGVSTCYGLDGPEIESRWGRDFPHP
jgi:hypothetical protein